MARALDYLRSFDKPQMTYSVALRTMVFCLAEPKKDHAADPPECEMAGGDADHRRDVTAARKGTWAYSAREGKGITRTRSLRCWHSTKRNAWEWRFLPARGGWPTSTGSRRSEPDGSWGYQPGEDRRSGSMTCAGICSLVITSGRLSSGRARVVGEQCRLLW